MDVTKEFEYDQFVSWFLAEAFAATEARMGGPLYSSETMQAISAVPRELKLTLNGVELNPLAAIKHLESQFDRQVAEKAREMISDAFGPLKDRIHDLTVDIEREFANALPIDQYWESSDC